LGTMHAYRYLFDRTPLFYFHPLFFFCIYPFPFPSPLSSRVSCRDVVFHVPYHCSCLLHFLIQLYYREPLKKFTRIITALTKTVTLRRRSGTAMTARYICGRGEDKTVLKIPLGDHMFLTANLQKHSYNPALSKKAPARKEGRKEGVMDVNSDIRWDLPSRRAQTQTKGGEKTKSNQGTKRMPWGCWVKLAKLAAS